MAEVIDLVGLVVEVIELANATISGCKRLVEAIRDAPKDLRVLLLTVSTFKALLQHVDSFMGTSDVARERKHLAEQVQQAKDILKEMDLLLAKPEDLLVKEKSSLTKLRGAWMLNSNQGKFAKSLEDLRRCQESINAILTADTCEIVRGIAVDVREIKDKLSVGERAMILDKFITVDPSGHHRDAWSLHEPVTSKWITRSDQWKAWIEGDARLCWIEGIPGAGKTILASYIIETIKAVAERSSSSLEPTIGWTYYYCYHTRTHKSEVEPFLRWIVSDLARKAKFIPPAVTDDHRHLSTEYLLAALNILCERFDTVFITIDALDECQDRTGFFGLIRRIHSSPAHRRLRILATSRGEADIRRAFEPISTCLSMKNPLLDQDIASYVRSQLSSDTAFELWGEDLRNKVESCLVAKSTGMFRWVSCQLETLKHLKQPSLVMQALNDLPKDLNTTYERILSKIPIMSRQLARNALALVLTMKKQPPEVLSEAVRWTVTRNGKPGDELLGVDALFELCICLLSIGADGNVCVAHRTVMEYLGSTHVARDFYLPFDFCKIILFQTLINRLLCPEFCDAQPSSTFWNWCALNFETRLESYHSRNVPLYKPLCDQVIQLLQSENGHVLRISTKLASRYSHQDISRATPMFCLGTSSAPGGPFEHVARLCMAGAWGIFHEYINRYGPSERAVLLAAKTTHPVCGECNLVEIATCRGEREYIEFFLQNGPKLDSNSKVILYLCDTLALGGDHEWPLEDIKQTFQLLLDSGADPNPKGVPVTPLQLAVISADALWVSMLLAAGADPNAIPDTSLIGWPEYLPVHYCHWSSINHLFEADESIPQEKWYSREDYPPPKPLDICRRHLSAEGREAVVFDRLEVEEIERLLLHYGATGSEPARASESECGPSPPVGPGGTDVEVSGSVLAGK